jgi:hypothetical protein
VFKLTMLVLDWAAARSVAKRKNKVWFAASVEQQGLIDSYFDAGTSLS